MIKLLLILTLLLSSCSTKLIRTNQQTEAKNLKPQNPVPEDVVLGVYNYTDPAIYCGSIILFIFVLCYLVKKRL